MGRVSTIPTAALAHTAAELGCSVSSFHSRAEGALHAAAPRFTPRRGCFMCQGIAEGTLHSKTWRITQPVHPDPLGRWHGCGARLVSCTRLARVY